MNWQIVGTLMSAFGVVGGGSVVSALLYRRREHANNSKTSAEAESVNVATSLSLLEPVRATAAERLAKIVRYRQALRRLMFHVAGLRDYAEDKGITLPHPPDDLQTELDELMEE